MEPLTIQKGGIGLPQSKTLARMRGREYFRQVLECGCPLPLCVEGLQRHKVF